MSLEAAMNTLADSQLKLAAALTDYTAAITVQTAVLENINANGVNITRSDAAPAAAAAAPEKKPRGKAAAAAVEPAAPAAEPEDDWGNEDEPEAKKVYTSTDVREAILAVRDKGGEKKNVDAAKAILAKLGVTNPTQVKTEDYEKAMDLCAKAMK